VKKIYDKIVITSSKIEPVLDKKTNVTTLKSESRSTLTQEIFNELREKVKTIRNNFTI
jgi:hypothetical protein